MMSAYETFMVMQIGDLSLYPHQTEFARPELQSKGKAEEMLLSNVVLLPSRAGAKTRELKIEGVVYASHGRSRSQLVNHMDSLFDRTVDVIGAEMLMGDVDTPGGNGYFPAVNSGLLWLHTMGHVAEVSSDMAKGGVEFEIELSLSTFWQALNPAEWFMIRRNEATPRLYQKASFEVDDISPLPSALNFLQDEQPFSFHKRYYEDSSHHYDPDYFTALSTYHDEDVPGTRYTSDWAKEASQLHRIHVDKLRWSGEPLSVYLFKNLTGEGTVTIDVEHDAELWGRESTRTTFDATAIDAAMTAAGETLIDSDVLVIGHIRGGAYILRDGARLLNVGDLISRDGGSFSGQIYHGENIIKVRGAEYAQHHIFRRF